MFWRLFLTQDFMDDLSSYSLPNSTFALILRGFSLRMVHKLTLVFSLHWECRWTNTYSFNLFADCKLLINFAYFWHTKTWTVVHDQFPGPPLPLQRWWWRCPPQSLRSSSRQRSKTTIYAPRLPNGWNKELKPIWYLKNNDAMTKNE